MKLRARLQRFFFTGHFENMMTFENASYNSVEIYKIKTRVFRP